MSAKPNARFWIHYREGVVKITLRPGETLAFHHGGPSEEGSSHHEEVFEYIEDDEVIEHTVCSWGRDCDGGYSDTREFVASVHKLASEPERFVDLGDTNWRGESILFHVPPTPDWVRKSSYCYDQYAEQAGY